MSTIFIDIETLPDMRPGALDAFIKDAAEDVKVPSGYTKEQMAVDLGMTNKDTIKFTSRDSMAAMWCEQVGPSKAKEVGESNWRKTSFDATQGQILMIGAAVDDDDPVVFADQDEAVILRDFRDFMEAVQRDQNMGLPDFVGHNLIDFDLPFVFRRSVILGVPPHRTFPVMPSRYSERVYDTMTRWAGHGNRIKLDTLAQALGAGGKGDIDGSQVYDYYAAGRIELLVEYCKNDVIMTREVWRHMNFKEAA